MFYIQNLNLKDNTIERMTIYEFDAADNLQNLIFADSATWSSAQWHLVNGSVRRFDHGTETYFEPFEAKQFERTEAPEQIAGSDKDLRGMTIKELQEQICVQAKCWAGNPTRTGEDAPPDGLSVCRVCGCADRCVNCHSVRQGGVFRRIGHRIFAEFSLLGPFICNP